MCALEQCLSARRYVLEYISIKENNQNNLYSVALKHKHMCNIFAAYLLKHFICRHNIDTKFETIPV